MWVSICGYLVVQVQCGSGGVVEWWRLVIGHRETTTCLNCPNIIVWHVGMFALRSTRSTSPTTLAYLCAFAFHLSGSPICSAIVIVLLATMASSARMYSFQCVRQWCVKVECL